MINQAERQPQFHALLIGIDFYESNDNLYPSLNGCVRDVELLETFFRTRLQHIEVHIKKLIASRTERDEPGEPLDQRPTYQNMVHALQNLLQNAQSGDLVWVYYAGHGGRTHTQYKEAKGANGYDEVLVPTNIGDPTTQYLRDVELGFLIKRMVEKGLIVTAVLDSCHSGGMTRGNKDVTIRSSSSIDGTPRLLESSVASREVLIENWLLLQSTGTRGFEVSSGWLPEPKGYVLLAACREFEAARESQLYGMWHNGVFTACLLDALWQMPQQSTYKMLYDRVRAKVRSQFSMQTPQLEGERDRIVFDRKEHIKSVYAVTVLDVEQEKPGSVRLDAGQMHTIQIGAQFCIYPNPIRVNDKERREKGLAFVEVNELGAVDCRANVIEYDKDQSVELGDQAVLITPGPLALRQKIRLKPNRELPEIREQDHALKNVEKALVFQKEAFVRLAGPDEHPDFLVTINAGGFYEIQSIDEEPLGHLRPPIEVDTPYAAERLVKRLIHLARYHAIWRLENPGCPSDIAGKLHVEFVRGRKPERAIEHLRREADGTPILEPGETVDLLIRNDSANMLHIAILDLAHDWSIEQLYPAYETFALETRTDMRIHLKASLDTTSYKEGIDVLKVLAARDPTDFSLLTLPALDRPDLSRGQHRGPRTTLEELLAAIRETGPATRAGLRVLRKAEWDWTSIQMEVRIQKK